MDIKRGDTIIYQNEKHIVLHVYTSEYLEIRKPDERYLPPVILVHRSEVSKR